MSLVLDTSLALSWYFEDERTPAADALLDRVADQGATVPGLWRLEIANGLRTAIRRKRIDEGFRNRAIAQLARPSRSTVSSARSGGPGHPDRQQGYAPSSAAQ